MVRRSGRWPGAQARERIDGGRPTHAQLQRVGRSAPPPHPRPVLARPCRRPGGGRRDHPGRVWHLHRTGGNPAIHGASVAHDRAPELQPGAYRQTIIEPVQTGRRGESAGKVEDALLREMVVNLESQPRQTALAGSAAGLAQTAPSFYASAWASAQRHGSSKHRTRTTEPCPVATQTGALCATV